MRTVNLDSLLAAAKRHNASDLHLIFGVPPAYRINGEIIIAAEDAMSAEQITAIIVASALTWLARAERA